LDEYAVEGGAVVAARHVDMPVFRVGPHARLPFTYSERQDGIADLPGKAVAMFRTSGKPAALAATLPALRRDEHDGRRGLFAHGPAGAPPRTPGLPCSRLHART
jgi:hypothetical protein